MSIHYSKLGRVVETRRWADVEIIFEDLVNPDDANIVVGLKLLETGGSGKNIELSGFL